MRLYNLEKGSLKTVASGKIHTLIIKEMYPKGSDEIQLLKYLSGPCNNYFAISKLKQL